MIVSVVVGTRPEAIKLAPVILALRSREDVAVEVLATGQHRELAREMLASFGLKADVDLDLMHERQTPLDVLVRVIDGLGSCLAINRPDWLVVQGDTTSVLGAALVAGYLRLPLAHVEAGLRSNDRANPFPEEFNRVLTGHASQMHFAPTVRARDNLLKEGIPEAAIRVTGNTVVDALLTMQRRVGEDTPLHPPALRRIDPEAKLLLLTTHRRENFGAPLEQICIATLAVARRPDVQILVPVHPNPAVATTIRGLLGRHPRILLTDPLPYPSLVWTMARSHVVLTDSGGIQEEAPSLGVPVLVLRNVTERPEAVECGAARLVGTDSQRIESETVRLLDDVEAYARMASQPNPFGDGRAAERICEALVNGGCAAPQRSNMPHLSHPQFNT